MTYTRTHFFRQYGATNIHEFWAVAVETFFEQPDEFKTKYPALFHETCRMLNQWPE
ncbi:MAG: zinc-dependent peptidase [Flavobacteriales bacterium]